MAENFRRLRNRKKKAARFAPRGLKIQRNRVVRT